MVNLPGTDDLGVSLDDESDKGPIESDQKLDDQNKSYKDSME